MQTLQQFCLRWNNHQPNFISVFTNLLNHEALVDVTIACEGKHLQAHRVVLSACSSYFQSLFTINPCQHPIVILKDIKFNDLKTMVDFMYHGEVNVSQEQLPAILKIAEMLKIKGLAEMPEQSSMIKSHSTSSDKADLLTPGDSNWGSTEQRSPSPMSPAARRKRLRKSSTGSGSGSTERTSEETPVDSGPHVKIEPSEDRHRSLSRQSLRNSNQEPSTDSEPKEGSQDSGTEDHVSRLSVDSRQYSAERQPSHERLTYPDKRQLSSESRQISHENRQLSSESRQASYEMRQLSHDSRQGSFETRDNRTSCQLSVDSRQASHESVLSHESSIESMTADDAINSNLSPSPGQSKVGTKRGRLLMRQSRIKKECDTHTSPDSEPGSPGFGSNLLTVPVKIERQRSEPTPASHSPPVQISTPNLNLLTVPQPSFLVKQHSFPNLPSHSSPPPLSQPLLVQRHIPQSIPQATQLKPVASLQSVDIETTRASSPSVPGDQLPIVRIISDEQTKVNSGFRYRVDELKRTSSMGSESPATAETSRSVHCPALRSGPALGCNFCWNTIDAHGRILRRKTKYHCPECQTNLCIVPCFQEYHQRLSPSSSSPNMKSETSHPPS